MAGYHIVTLFFHTNTLGERSRVLNTYRFQSTPDSSGITFVFVIYWNNAITT